MERLIKQKLLHAPIIALYRSPRLSLMLVTSRVCGTGLSVASSRTSGHESRYESRCAVSAVGRVITCLETEAIQVVMSFIFHSTSKCLHTAQLAIERAGDIIYLYISIITIKTSNTLLYAGHYPSTNQPNHHQKLSISSRCRRYSFASESPPLLLKLIQ